ncbi:MAG: cyanophycinase [Ignavibacteriales bacterium]|nr:Cyanophycinase [Ignavibacteriaceae bacterium]QOJ27686.1 MAG: cyanophycinase [Ignavibacteriales bacterium]
MNYFIAFVLLFASLVSSQTKGSLVIIGGGDRPDYVMEKIMQLAGGKKAKLVIIPNASGEPVETAEYQKKGLNRLGYENISYIYGKQAELDTPENLAKLDGVTGIFFSGGDQSVLTRDLLGTKFLARIKEIYRQGGVISGTSAGAAVMSKIMLTGDEKKNKDSSSAFITIEKGNVDTKEGFGFLENVIVDQHFIKRKRHNRLMSLMYENPKLLGIAIDEATAIVVTGGDKFEVLGESQVMVMNATKAKNIRTDKHGNFAAEGMVIDLLINGDKYSISKKQRIK